MKKRTEQLLVILSVVFAAGILAVSILGVGRQYNVFALGGACGGIAADGVPGTTTLIDPETGTSVDVLAIPIILNCAGGYAQGTFGSAWLRQNTGFDFDSGFTFTASAVGEQLVYPVVNERITLNELAYTGGAGDPGVICTLVQPGGVYKGHSLVARGVKGVLGTIPRAEWAADLTLATDDGQSITKRVSSVQTTADWQRDNETIAEASWPGGNLVTGEAPPAVAGTVVVYPESVKKWNLATTAEWDAYRDATTRTCTGIVATGVPQQNADTTGRIAAQNTALSALFASTATLPVPGQFSADGSGYVVTAAPQIQRVKMTLYIKGSFLGMVRPSGRPTLQFGGTDPTAYHAGNPGFLLFTAGNDGNYSAGFDLAVTCNGAPVATAQRLTIGAKQAVPVRLPFTLSTQGTYNCEGRLTDLTSGAAAATAKSVFVLAVQLCQPGQSNIRTLYRLDQCKTDGSAWETVMDCSNVLVEVYKANTCVAGVAFGLVGSNATTPSAVDAWVKGGAQPKGTCTYESSAMRAEWLSGGGSACSKEDRVVGTETALGLTVDTCQSLGTITPKTYETRASAPIQFKDGQFTCAGAMNSPKVSVVGVREVPDSATAPVPPSVPASSLATPAFGAGAAPGGAPKPSPGFEAVFAIAGLLIVAYLVSRRKP